MIFRAALAISVVILAAAHQPDVGFGRPTMAVPFANATDVSRCNRSDAWLCGPLHTVEGLRDRLIAGADRVRDDLHAQRSQPRSGTPAF